MEARGFRRPGFRFFANEWVYSRLFLLRAALGAELRARLQRCAALYAALDFLTGSALGAELCACLQRCAAGNTHGGGSLSGLLRSGLRLHSAVQIGRAHV